MISVESCDDHELSDSKHLMKGHTETRQQAALVSRHEQMLIRSCRLPFAISSQASRPTQDALS